MHTLQKKLSGMQVLPGRSAFADSLFIHLLQLPESIRQSSPGATTLLTPATSVRCQMNEQLLEMPEMKGWYLVGRPVREGLVQGEAQLQVVCTEVQHIRCSKSRWLVIAEHQRHSLRRPVYIYTGWAKVRILQQHLLLRLSLVRKCMADRAKRLSTCQC